MNNNVFLALLISLGILFGFQYMYVKPHQNALHSQYIAQNMGQNTQSLPQSASQNLRNRADVIKETPRVTIATPELAGSINLKGARIDDLSLTQYHETDDKTSPSIILLSPSGSADPEPAYYVDLSWLADKGAMPNADTIWKADAKQLTPDHPVHLTWNNGQGLTFERTIAIDDKEMFTVTDHIGNKGGEAVALYPFGTVARQGMPIATGRVHEGALGVLDGTLEEYKYKDMMDKKKAVESTGGWLGITDKYWLVAMIPAQDEKITADFAYNRLGASDVNKGFFQSDYRGTKIIVPAGGGIDQTVHLFAGAKQIKNLDHYGREYNIPHFDKAIDFGWFYFLTRPFLYLLTAIDRAVGNMGLAILIFTVLLKLVTLPLSLKSYHSMSRMKAMQPELKRIQERFADDRMRMGQEQMELYKREKISPFSGCVPIVVQIPIFFALYKVLYVNIEMRQAPFFGWIHDMSVADPTSLFNLFGTLHWTLPSALQIGVWPVLMGMSMFLQQKMSPQPPDQSQARIFMFLPIVFTYMFARMPAGLVIYWTWSNLIGIVQQWYIMRKDALRKTTV